MVLPRAYDIRPHSNRWRKTIRRKGLFALYVNLFGDFCRNRDTNDFDGDKIDVQTILSLVEIHIRTRETRDDPLTWVVFFYGHDLLPQVQCHVKGAIMRLTIWTNWINKITFICASEHSFAVWTHTTSSRLLICFLYHCKHCTLNHLCGVSKSPNYPIFSVVAIKSELQNICTKENERYSLLCYKSHGELTSIHFSDSSTFHDKFGMTKY